MPDSFAVCWVTRPDRGHRPHGAPRPRSDGQGERIQGKDAGERLLEDWDLDLDEHRRDGDLPSVTGRSPKLVHKIMLSMPPGTPATGFLEAARNFAREEFALKHRYAFRPLAELSNPHFVCRGFDHTACSKHDTVENFWLGFAD